MINNENGNDNGMEDVIHAGGQILFKSKQVRHEMDRVKRIWYL